MNCIVCKNLIHKSYKLINRTDFYCSEENHYFNLSLSFKNEIQSYHVRLPADDNFTYVLSFFPKENKTVFKYFYFINKEILSCSELTFNLILNLDFSNISALNKKLKTYITFQ